MTAMGLTALAVLSACQERKAAASAAKCPRALIRLAPSPGASVPLNASFLVASSGEARAALLQLGEGTAALQGPDGGVIPLQVTQRLDVSDQRAVALLTPARPLARGTQYRLTGLAAPAPEAAWVTLNAPDSAPPVWRGAPRLEALRVGGRSTGPDVEATLAMPVSEDTLAALLEVRTPEGQRVLTDLRPVQHQRVVLLSGGCEGSLRLTPGRHYEVSLTPIDSAGNRGEPRTFPLHLSNP